MLGEEKKTTTNKTADRQESLTEGRPTETWHFAPSARTHLGRINHPLATNVCRDERESSRSQRNVACPGGTKGSERDSECVSPALRSHPEQGSLFANPPPPPPDRGCWPRGPRCWPRRRGSSRYVEATCCADVSTVHFRKLERKEKENNMTIPL